MAAYGIEQFLDDLFQQQIQMDKLLRRVSAAIQTQRGTERDGDRVPYAFVGHITFPQADDAAQDVVFTVPEGQDFYAERVAFYPSFRFVTTDEGTNGPDENYFKPCVFTSYEGVFNPRIETDAAAVDCFVSISENYKTPNGQMTRDLQNLPTPVQLHYSGPVNYRRGGNNESAVFNVLLDPYYANFEFPTAGLFSVPWLLTGGSSVTLKIAPSFAGIREDPANSSSDPTLQNEYRITAVLSGFKRIP